VWDVTRPRRRNAGAEELHDAAARQRVGTDRRGPLDDVTDSPGAGCRVLGSAGGKLSDDVKENHRS